MVAQKAVDISQLFVVSLTHLFKCYYAHLLYIGRRRNGLLLARILGCDLQDLEKALLPSGRVSVKGEK